MAIVVGGGSQLTRGLGSRACIKVKRPASPTAIEVMVGHFRLHGKSHEAWERGCTISTLIELYGTLIELYGTLTVRCYCCIELRPLPRPRYQHVPIAAGSGNMINVLYSVYRETSLVCSRIVTAALVTIQQQTHDISLYTLYNI